MLEEDARVVVANGGFDEAFGVVGRVDDALGTEAVDESVRDFEGATVNADVFAETEDSGVVFHFFPDSLADGFEVSELHKFQDFKVSWANTRSLDCAKRFAMLIV